MMSNAALNPFKKYMFSSGGPPSESPSEISSADSDWNDLKLIAAQLNISNLDDLKTERFKVNRNKLSDMIRMDSDTDGKNYADVFFDTVMKETSTYIGWPSRLKLGAKTKKDPNVRIVGKAEDVAIAKDRVMSYLDSRGDRVILKMDISYTDHSYIISRGGRNIQRIMEETSTHIHFPDSNRSNSIEKSNQVSLCGNLEGVEKARHLIRASAPVVFSFELPIVAPGHPVPDNETVYVKEIEEKFSVQIIFSTRSKLHSSLVLVKGSENDYVKVKNATQTLISRICENITSPILVQLQIEIAIQHHFIVTGKNYENVRAIMKTTGTEIMFPDAGDMNIKPLKRSQITIKGSIEGVYSARQQLIGSLPVTLIFDHPDNTVDSDKIASIMKDLDVFINVRQKLRQSNLSIVVKGIEKFIGKVYEARHQILSLNTKCVVPEIPKLYFSTQDGKMSISELIEQGSNPTSPLTPTYPDFRCANNNINSNNSSNSLQWNFSLSNESNIDNLRNHLAQNMNMSPITANNTAGLILKNNQIVGNSFNNRFLHPNTSYGIHRPFSASNSNSNLTSDTSGYQSFSSSTNSLEQSNHISMQSSSNIYLSPDTTVNYTPTNNHNENYQRNKNDGDATPTLNDGKNKEKEFVFSQYDKKKLYGLKAIDVPPVYGEVRIPTPTWAGMALSCTSPIPHDLSPNDRYPMNRSNGTPYNLGMTTSLMEVTPRQQRHYLNNYDDIYTVMIKLGLEHYTRNFVKHEIDIEIFKTLNDNDLQLLGITTLGARRKLLLAIREMTVNASRFPTLLEQTQTTFSGSAAPGAERRLSGRW